jgi:8-oxo-dGTP pyrophosphatase MutT (NUDIX family)
MTILANQTKREYVGAGIILVKDDTYLLLKGKATGVWSFSKGHPESEDIGMPLNTAARETYEETGLIAGRDYDIIGDSIRFGKRHYWIGIMRPDARRVIVARAEHETAAWFSWTEIQNLKANTDVRCWIKKSQGPNGKFQRLTAVAPYVLQRRDTHLIDEDHIVSLA